MSSTAAGRLVGFVGPGVRPASGNNNDCAKRKFFDPRCRTCLSKNRDTVPMSTEVPFENHTGSYWDCLRHCTGLSIPEKGTCSYTYPTQICLRCSKALEVATHFVQMAQDSEKKLNAEATNAKPHANGGGKIELKRKAEDQYCQQFTKFVQNYEPVIEENVLYMRGAKMPRVEPPPEEVSETGNDVILFDVIYDNTMDEDNENDVSDTKNNETFFEASEMPADDENENDTAKNGIEKSCSTFNDKSNNNNDDNVVNNNNTSNLPVLTSSTTDLIQRALYLTCMDNNPPSSMNIESFEEIKSNLFKSLANCSLSENKSQCDNNINAKPNAKEIVAVVPLVPQVQNMANWFFTGNAEEAEPNGTTLIHSTELLSYRCRSCNNYNSSKKEDMCTHLTEHHKIETNFDLFYTEYQLCPECNRIFKDQKSVRTHYTRMHSGMQQGAKRDCNEIYKCDNCDKSFNMKSSLQAHERYCKAKDPVSCTFCTKKFNTVRNYEAHLQREHAVNTIHECEVCGNIFKTADSLAMHRKRHTERHYQCEECPLNYVNATELKVHVERTHVHHKHVNCSSCGLQFQNRSLLREHEQRTHQKKMWRCETCTFEATNRTRLRQHQYEHTGYPYKCDICDEEFAERNKIRQHSKKLHSIELTDDQLATMFRERLGYTSRQDAFSKANNALEIPGFDDDCFDHLKELGLDYDDITNDLFSNNNMLGNLWI